MAAGTWCHGPRILAGWGSHRTCTGTLLGLTHLVTCSAAMGNCCSRSPGGSSSPSQVRASPGPSKTSQESVGERNVRSVKTPRLAAMLSILSEQVGISLDDSHAPWARGFLRGTEIRPNSIRNHSYVSSKLLLSRKEWPDFGTPWAAQGRPVCGSE